MPHEGVNIMRLVNLNALYIDMQQHNADSMVFAAQVEGHPFSCTFAKVIGTLHLFVTALGQNPFTIDIQVDNNFNVINGLFLANDIYEKLRVCLEIKTGWENPFRPANFIQNLDAVTPTKFNGNRPTRHEVAALSVATSPNLYEDADKIYFCGWRKNPAGSSVSRKNQNKSLLYFPAKEVELRTELNMSSCWSANPNEEALNALNQLIADNIIP